MKKRYTAVIFLSLLSLTLASCGTDSSQTDFSNADSPVQNMESRMDAETQESPDREEAEPASDKDVITDPNDLPFPLGSEIRFPGAFTGTAYLTEMIDNEDVYRFPQTNHISFEPGARSNWHSHGGMVILVTGGIGYYQEEGQPAQIIRRGDVVECAPGVRHWHGAVADTSFSQIAINTNHDNPGGEESDKQN